MSALTALAVVLLGGIILFAPRRYALLAVFAAIVFISQRNGVEILGLRMYPLRFLELAGFIRVIARGEVDWRSPSRLDRAVLLAYGYVTAAFLIRSAFGFGTSSEVMMVTPASKIGDLVDVLLIYTTFRGLVRELADVRWLLGYLVVLLVPFVAFLAIERWTGSNPLQIFGANATYWVDDVDGGRVRCYGSFAHPALLGTFGASFALIYFALVLGPEKKTVGAVGVALCLAIVFFSSSGGPVTVLAVGAIGWACWWVRSSMRWIRLSLLATLIFLAAIMRDPIWYLPSKMSILFGGSGWHRSYLMHQAITHADQWWLLGMPLDLTASWFPYLVLGAADITNLYVAFGLDGGLGAMLLFLWLIVVAFSENGKSLIALGSEGLRSEELLVWGLGVALMSNVANYFSITYFDQTNALWLFQLSVVACVAGSSLVETGSVSGARWRPVRYDRIGG